MRGWRNVAPALLVAGILACEATPELAQQPASTTTVSAEAAATSTAASPTPIARSGPRERTLRLGLIGARAARAITRYTPLAGHLARAVGLDGGEVIADGDPSRAIGRLCSGEVDLLLDSIGSVHRAIETCSARVVVVAAKKGTLRYRSVIFVRRGSSIRSIADLGGKLILFEDAASTSAYLLPRAMLSRAGFEMDPVERSPRPESVRYAFANDELNIVGGVVHGRADAGAMSTTDLEDYSSAEIEVIAKSEPVPRQLLIASPGLAADRYDDLRSVALTLHNEAAAATKLEAASITKFDSFGDGDRQAVDLVARALGREKP